MSCQRMTLVERTDIFKLLYVERLTPSAIAEALNRKPSSISRETAKGMDNGMYNPVTAEARHLEARRNQRYRTCGCGGRRERREKRERNGEKYPERP